MASSDRQIGNALLAVDHLIRHYSICWAGIDAARTTSAVIGNGIICRDLHIEDQFAEEEIGTVLLVEQKAVLSDPTQTRSPGPSAFVYGPESTKARPPTYPIVHVPSAELFIFLRSTLVITAQSVARSGADSCSDCSSGK